MSLIHKRELTFEHCSHIFTTHLAINAPSYVVSPIISPSRNRYMQRLLIPTTDGRHRMFKPTGYETLKKEN